MPFLLAMTASDITCRYLTRHFGLSLFSLKSQEIAKINKNQGRMLMACENLRISEI